MHTVIGAAGSDKQTIPRMILFERNFDEVLDPAPCLPHQMPREFAGPLVPFGLAGRFALDDRGDIWGLFPAQLHGCTVGPQ